MLGGWFQGQSIVWNPSPMAAFPLLSSWLTYFASLVCQDSRPTLIFPLPGAPRYTKCSFQRSVLFENSSQSLPQYSCTCHQRTQLLHWLAGLPS
jgi:hypothetical protein